MTSRPLELADELSLIVGKPDLFDYLGVGGAASAEEAQAALRARRRYLQGMQSNPKYKREAVFLIKHFGAIESLLGDVDAYRETLARRREEAQLPALEIAIRTALALGSPGPEQLAYLERTAAELGIGRARFTERLTALAEEAGVRVHGEAEDTLDFYRILAVQPGAVPEAIQGAYLARLRELERSSPSPATELQRARLDRAWAVLSDPATRRAYDAGLSRTGPPARDRGALLASPAPALTSPGAPTAPPVRARVAGPQRPPPVPSHALPGSTLGLTEAAQPPLEIVGEPIRHLRLGDGLTVQRIHLRNPGTQPLPGRITVDEPWLSPSLTQLDPTAREQVIEVRIDPAAVPSSPRTGVVTILTDRGDRASIVFEVTRARGPGPLVVGAIAAGVLAALVVIAWIAIG